MIKKIIFIAVAIVALAGIGTIIYYGRETLNILQISPAPKEKKETAAPLPPRLKAISSRPVFDYSPAGDGILYAGDAGQIIKINAAGQEETLSDGVEQLRLFSVSPDGKEILIGFGPRDNFQLSQFVVADKILKPLNKGGAVSAAWSPDSKKVAYLKSSAAAGESDLVIADISKEKIGEVKVMSFALADYALEWPSPGRIILKPRPSALYIAPLLAVDLAKKTVAPLSAPSTGAVAKWSASLKQGLLFRGDERNNSFSLTGENGEPLVDLSRITTLPNKCAFSDAAGIIFCAVPKELPEGTIFIDDYFKRIFYTSDSVYSLAVTDDESGKKQLKVEKYYDFDPLTIDADNLTIKNEKLYFINRYNEKIYSLDLSE
ncbi:MAG: hypothetical protein HZA37_00260 [Parcubacteria group bacterium]|nr:hypothetical protein [Parcubacteria group bacterium]